MLGEMVEKSPTRLINASIKLKPEYNIIEGDIIIDLPLTYTIIKAANV